MIDTLAKKTFLALKNPFDTVKDVKILAINPASKWLETHEKAYYVGVKDTPVIPTSIFEKLNPNGCFYHTKDVMAHGGRAIDMYLVNPLTGKWMSGSSSGTALNVFYHINDIGIGTDGGGSVLAPAASLNLYGFISSMIEREHVKQYQKKSTDGIRFSPSIGLITRDLTTLKLAVSALLTTTKNKHDYQIMMINKKSVNPYVIPDYDRVYDLLKSQITVVDAPPLHESREKLIDFISNTATNNQILVSIEGPIDHMGMGDSIYGSFDTSTKKSQMQSGKGLMRVVNMANKMACTIPLGSLGFCALIVCEDKKELIPKIWKIAQMLQVETPPTVTTYFSNLDMYL